MFIWSFIYVGNHKKLKVDFLDVGQGDSIYIEAPNGNNFLIDGGIDRKVLGSLGNVLPFASKNIDVVLATHPDADHIGGLPFVFDNYNVSAYVDNGVKSDSSVFKTLENKIESEKSLTPGRTGGQAQRVKASAGMKIILDQDKNIVFDVLSPYMNVQKVNDTNMGSIVGKLTYGSSTFIFTGDTPINVEQNLVKKATQNNEQSDCVLCRPRYSGDPENLNLESDVLKVGHHGSKTSSSEAFLKAVNPQFAIISVGQKNMYGHPHKEVIDLLNKLGIKTLRTSEKGTVKCESGGGEVVCK
jgi:competence protein ComEC